MLLQTCTQIWVHQLVPAPIPIGIQPLILGLILAGFGLEITDPQQVGPISLTPAMASSQLSSPPAPPKLASKRPQNRLFYTENRSKTSPTAPSSQIAPDFATEWKSTPYNSKVLFYFIPSQAENIKRHKFFHTKTHSRLCHPQAKPWENKPKEGQLKYTLFKPGTLPEPGQRCTGRGVPYKYSAIITHLVPYPAPCPGTRPRTPLHRQRSSHRSMTSLQPQHSSIDIPSTSKSWCRLGERGHSPPGKTVSCSGQGFDGAADFGGCGCRASSSPSSPKGDLSFAVSLFF